MKQQQEICRNQSCIPQLHNHNVLESIENTSDQQQHLEVNEQLVPENVTSDENTTVNNDNDIPMSSCNTGINVARVNVATSTDLLNQSVDATTNTYPVYQSDANIQNVVFTLDSDTQTVINKDDISIQTKVVATVDASTEAHKPDIQDICTSTDDIEMTQPSTESAEDDDMEDSSLKMTPFTIEAIQHDDKAVLFCMGFPSHTYLMTCFNFLGLAVAVLNYHSKDSEKEPYFLGI